MNKPYTMMYLHYSNNIIYRNYFIEEGAFTEPKDKTDAKANDTNIKHRKL